MNMEQMAKNLKKGVFIATGVILYQMFLAQIVDKTLPEKK